MTCILKSILRKDSIKYQVAITAEPKNYICKFKLDY